MPNVWRASGNNKVQNNGNHAVHDLQGLPKSNEF